jgi:regulator of replication initiation timing
LYVRPCNAPQLCTYLISQAHQHASQARSLLSSSSPPYPPRVLSEAASAHALAASSFASAAKTTRDPEAHRTLELLVKEHTRWAERLKRQAEAPAPLETVAESEPPSEPAAKPAAVPSSYPFSGSTPHYPARLQKSTSSLATNLASARGIPQQPRSAASTTQTTTTSRRRQPEASAKPTTSPLSLLPPDQPSTDASFSKFYNSLNSLVAKIGSPFTASLAFTGLPVGTGPNDNEITAEVLPKAWRARNRHLNLNNLENQGAESFYVVPYSGGTASYANVARRADSKEEDQPRRDDEEARYAGHDKTLEELQLENVTLRRTLEQLSRNMSKWQRKTRESEKELKSSIMALSKSGAASKGINDILSQAQRRSWLHVPNEEEDEETYSEGRRIGEMELIKEEAREKVLELDDRVKILERELRERDAELERMHRENEKLRKTVQKFKDRWDALREGAKKRERNNVAGGGSVRSVRGDE